MQTLTKISVEDYIKQETEASSKSEYHNGEVAAMAGASEAHNVIVNNLIYLINHCLREKGCRVYPSDLLLKLEKYHKYVYPDLMLVCEKPVLEEHSGLDALINPLVVIEVLSESTKKYDQSEKMNCYLELESLAEYVMIDSEQVGFASYQKTKNQNWLFRTIKNIEENIQILDCEIELKEIYRNVSFEQS